MEQKFNKGDLVELPTGVRMFFTSYSDAVEGNVWLSCKESANCVDFMVGSDSLKLITPAKQYIEVNGHKVPKPLSYSEVKNLWINAKSDIYSAVTGKELHDYFFCYRNADCIEESVMTSALTGFCYDNQEDAIAMSKALLSAIPKQQ